MVYKLSRSSLDKLRGVHPDLVRVTKRAIELTTVDFRITCGVRTLAEQRKLFAAGKSKTLKSYHITGDAVDFVSLSGGAPNYDHWSDYKSIADAFKQAAKELKVPIEWGGDWKSFKDGPHIQRKR